MRSNFFIKLRNWEYWPFGIVQFPAILYFPWLALRARSVTFFSAANPGITMGGLFGESKFEVLSKLPSKLVPRSVLVAQPVSADALMATLAKNDLRFPLVFKPDIGERGYMVRRIHNEREALRYLGEMRFNFIVQELVDLPLEFGVFYSRLPDEHTGRVTSVVMKEMLTVEGDGATPIEDLILQKDRAKLQWETLRVTLNGRLREVLPRGERMEIVSIGNHCLGTKFLNANHLINEKLCNTFDAISKQIDGFYFGRFDLRCESLEDLYAGNIQILELNGCGAEPAHIYDPQFSFFKAAYVLLQHWKTIFMIAEQNQARGHAYLSFREAVQHYQNFKTKIQ